MAFSLAKKEAKSCADTESHNINILVCMYSIYVLHLPQTYLTLLLCSPSLSSLRYITAFLASSTPAYVQLGLKGKAELFCL